MQLVQCNGSFSLRSPPPPPRPWGMMLATLGELTDFRVAFNGNRRSVTLVYGDERKKRTRRKKTCAVKAGGGGGGGPKPAAKLSVAVPFFVPPPAQPGASGECTGAKTGGSTAGGGPVCEADPDFAIQTVPHFGTPTAVKRTLVSPSYSSG